MKKFWKWLGLGLLGLLLAIIAVCFATQLFVDHEEAAFNPDYEKLELTSDSGLETVFLQTGLSGVAARAVMDKEGPDGILRYQQAFFTPKEAVCDPVFLFFTRQDNATSPTPGFPHLQPGDILVTKSIHSVGWRHGHAAIVLREGAVLQLVAIGTRSWAYDMTAWETVSQYAVLRLKDRPEAFEEDIVCYIQENLLDIPYNVFSGFLGRKTDLHQGSLCTQLVWQAYYGLGYDIDGDGGRYVSAQDILDSPLLEVVQVYGMDPREFQDRIAK